MVVSACVYSTPQAVPSLLCNQTGHEPDPAQNAHKTRLQTRGEIPHRPRCVTGRVWSGSFVGVHCGCTPRAEKIVILSL